MSSQLLTQLENLIDTSCQYGISARLISFLNNVRERNFNNERLDQFPIDLELASELQRICAQCQEMCAFVEKHHDKLKEHNHGEPGEPLYTVLNPAPRGFSVKRVLDYWNGKQFSDSFNTKKDGELVFTNITALIQSWEVVFFSHDLMVKALVALQEGLSAK